MPRECWAKSLGDCDGPLTGEHSISKCIYPDQMIYVQGFDFCKDAPKKLHILSLTQNNLCKGHNQRLGADVDHVGGRLFESIRKFVKRRNEQADFPSISWLQENYVIDARTLERWFLKIMMGIAFNSSLLIGSEGTQEGVIPSGLARAVFGLEELPIGQGLYIAHRNRETFNLEDRFHYTAKVIENRLLLGYFKIHGLRFYLNLEGTNGAVYRTIEDSNVFYRKTHFIETSADLTSTADIRSLMRRPVSYSQKLSIS